MGYIGYIWARIIRGLFVLPEVRKATLGGVAVGALVGIIIALIKGDWHLILIGCGVGFLAGIVLGLIIKAVSMSRRRR